VLPWAFGDAFAFALEVASAAAGVPAFDAFRGRELPVEAFLLPDLVFILCYFVKIFFKDC
jgi:hypothetical protein